LSNPEIDLDKADPTMAERLRQMRPIGVIIAYGVIATMIAPLVALKQMPVASFCILLAFLMGLGLIGASLWGIWTLYRHSPVTGMPVENRNQVARNYLITSLGTAVIVYLATWFLTWVFSNSWVTYTALKSGGLITYVLFGLTPVVAYIQSVYGVATRKIITDRYWSFGIALILVPWSIMAPVIWVGFKVYSDYHVW
jgi:hypothetical protein